jgi:hypothetical protein
VPDEQQRLWRTMTRTRQQLTGHRRSRNADLILPDRPPLWGPQQQG